MTSKLVFMSLVIIRGTNLKHRVELDHMVLSRIVPLGGYIVRQVNNYT